MYRYSEMKDKSVSKSFREMRHAFCCYGISERQSECVFGLANDQRQTDDGKVGLLPFSDKCGTNSETGMDGKIWLE